MTFEEEYNRFLITDELRKSFDKMASGYSFSHEASTVTIKTVQLGTPNDSKKSKETKNA